MREFIFAGLFGSGCLIAAWQADLPEWAMALLAVAGIIFWVVAVVYFAYGLSMMARDSIKGLGFARLEAKMLYAQYLEPLSERALRELSKRDAIVISGRRVADNVIYTFDIAHVKIETELIDKYLELSSRSEYNGHMMPLRNRNKDSEFVNFYERRFIEHVEEKLQVFTRHLVEYGYCIDVGGNQSAKLAPGISYEYLRKIFCSRMSFQIEEIKQQDDTDSLYEGGRQFVDDGHLNEGDMIGPSYAIGN